MKHDGGKLIELYMYGSLVVLTGDEVWHMLRHEPGIWKHALQRGKGVKRVQAAEAREAKAENKTTG